MTNFHIPGVYRQPALGADSVVTDPRLRIVLASTSMQVPYRVSCMITTLDDCGVVYDGMAGQDVYCETSQGLSLARLVLQQNAQLPYGLYRLHVYGGDGRRTSRLISIPHSHDGVRYLTIKPLRPAHSIALALPDLQLLPTAIPGPALVVESDSQDLAPHIRGDLWEGLSIPQVSVDGELVDLSGALIVFTARAEGSDPDLPATIELRSDSTPAAVSITEPTGPVAVLPAVIDVPAGPYIYAVRFTLDGAIGPKTWLTGGWVIRQV